MAQIQKVLMAEPVGATEAFEAGFVTEVAADSAYLETAYRYANRLAALPPSAMRLNKALLRRAHNDIINEIAEHEWETLQQSFKSEELQEAIQAFMEKRPADFSRFT